MKEGNSYKHLYLTVVKYKIKTNLQVNNHGD